MPKRSAPGFPLHALLLDQLIDEIEHAERYSEAERFGSFDIYQLESGQIGRRRTLENLADVDTDFAGLWR